jgi:hypothetical protein
MENLLVLKHNSYSKIMKIDNFKDSFGNYKKYISKDGKRIWTKSGQTWNAMRARCKVDGCVQNKFDNYIGCYLSDNFKNYNYFVEWHEAQIGFDLTGYDLDKDLLIPGNKIYSENTCVLIPCQLNSFMTTGNSSRGLYPQGVNFDAGKYRAALKINGKHKHIGHFMTPELAYNAYKLAKQAEAKRWAKRLELGEFTVDFRVITALKNWSL